MAEHGKEMAGYLSPRCDFGMDGCDDLACVCRCHRESDDRERALAWLAERVVSLGWSIEHLADRDIAEHILNGAKVEQEYSAPGVFGDLVIRIPPGAHINEEQT